LENYFSYKCNSRTSSRYKKFQFVFEIQASWEEKAIWGAIHNYIPLVRRILIERNKEDSILVIMNRIMAMAIAYGNCDIVELLIKEFKVNVNQTCAFVENPKLLVNGSK
jgi:hypothetical protein